MRIVGRSPAGAWSVIALNLVAAAALAIVSAATGSAADGLTALLPLSFLGVGAVVTLRQPNNTEGWILLAVATAWWFALLLPFDGSWVPAVTLMATQLLLRFPDGRLPSPRWRWISRVTLVSIPVLALVVTSGSQLRQDNTPNPYYVAWVTPFVPVLGLLPMAMLISVTSLIVRYRRAGIVEREQIRWLAWAGATVVLLYISALGISLSYASILHQDSSSSSSSWFAGSDPFWITLLQDLALASFLLIPAAIGVAILRYRLYEIDRLISRTTSYALVSAVVVATYVGCVAVMSRLAPASSDLAIAVATLTAASVVRPLQRRIQGLVDRRFNREHFNATQTIDAFAAQLRLEVNPDLLTAQLLHVIRQTLQPQSLTLWLPKGQVEQNWPPARGDQLS